MCNPKVSSRHGFLNSGFVKLRKLFLNSNNDRRSGFALSLAVISAKFPRSPIFLGTKYGAKCYPQHKYWWAGQNMAACSPVCEFTINVLRMCGRCECGNVRFSHDAGTGPLTSDRMHSARPCAACSHWTVPFRRKYVHQMCPQISYEFSRRGHQISDHHIATAEILRRD